MSFAIEQIGFNVVKYILELKKRDLRTSSEYIDTTAYMILTHVSNVTSNSHVSKKKRPCRKQYYRDLDASSTFYMQSGRGCEHAGAKWQK